MIKITDDNFAKEVIESDLPVMVDCWAPTCAPCMSIMPLVEELAEAWAGRVKVVKMNINQAFGVAKKYKVLSLPTFLFMRKGVVIARLTGTRSKAVIEECLQKVSGD